VGKKTKERKMAEFIMITGDCEKGKTSSLHFVHEILVTKGGKVTAFERVGGTTYRDFSDVVEYNNKKIAIFTAGDIHDHVRKAILYCETKHADFLIFACNSKRKDCKELIDLKEILEKAYSIEKTHGSDLQSNIAANWYDAWRIIEKLEDYMKR
jgi:hypothetical protein